MSRYYKRAQNIGWFVIEVDTSITAGSGNTGVGNFEFRVFGTANNFNIVWGDGTMDRNVTADITHNYTSAGIYKVAVVGVLPQVFYNITGDRRKVRKILSFGDIEWGSFLNAFNGCNIQEIDQIINNGKSVISFARAFRDMGLNKIPQGFFHNCPNVTTFAQCFTGNGPIPNCPSDLFANNPLVTTFAVCFLSSTLPTATYSDMLVNLDQNNANTNVPFHGGNSMYNSVGYIGRHNLITNKTWTITDGGVDTSVVFQLEIDTTIAGTTGVGNFELRGAGTRQYTVDWGDGNVSTGLTGNVTHNYASAGIYTISVAGLFPRVNYNFAGDRLKVKKILSFGDIVWGNFAGAFYGCGITDINGVIANGQAVTSFSLAFAVNNLNTIPIGLVDNCPLVTTFENAFSINQLDIIPQFLFHNCPLVTNFRRCFRNNGLIPNCPSDLFANNPLANNFTDCFVGSLLPTQTYSDMLISLDQNNNNTNVPFHGGTSTYTGAAAIAARANLVNVKGWIITDGGQV